MIHQFRNNGYNIVLDVHSGSVHIVDDLVYDVIAFLDSSFDEDEAADALAGRPAEVKKAVVCALKDRWDGDELAEAFDECALLARAGTLFSKDVYREKVLDFKGRQTDRKSVV